AGGLAFANGHREGRMSWVEVVVSRICIAKESFLRGLAKEILAEVAGDAFRCRIPEEDLAMPVDQVNAHRQAIDDGVEYFRIVSSEHRHASLGTATGGRLGQVRCHVQPKADPYKTCLLCGVRNACGKPMFKCGRCCPSVKRHPIAAPRIAG